ncbi:TolC family protein [Sulfurimonas sp.]|uniref:TolC family protein n=1 Tax=Sulfurimonas sp. TaxID=2022749 RepID=UPI0026296B5C|nr:TolC family protein [Sulfurimonas sp.]
MRTLILSLLLLSNSLFGVELESVINTALQKSPSLEVINARLTANKQSVDIADQFANPELSLVKNTLDASEPMSKTVLSVKQNIPYYSKRAKREDVAVAEDAVLKEQLRAVEAKLVERIKTEAYTIWELRELTNIIDEYIKLTKRNITLYESYTSINSSQHMGIMKAELSLSDLKVQKTALEAKIFQAYARLSALAAFRVEKLDIDLAIKSKPELERFRADLGYNPEIALREKEIAKQNAKVALADVNNYPDVNILAGYNYREKYDDYFSVGVGLSLPIYGTEDAKEERERALLLAKRSQKADTQLGVNAALESYYAVMLSSYKIYHIIQDDALPQVAHMFELSTASISTGSDLFKYIDVLFDKLSLEKKSITAIANYNKAEAKIAELQGKLQ